MVIHISIVLSKSVIETEIPSALSAYVLVLRKTQVIAPIPKEPTGWVGVLKLWMPVGAGKHISGMPAHISRDSRRHVARRLFWVTLLFINGTLEKRQILICPDRQIKRRQFLAELWRSRVRVRLCIYYQHK